MFPKAVIIGVGQLGASIGMNLVSMGLAREVIGSGRSRSNLRTALRLGAIHRIGSARDLAAADLIVLAAPVGAIRETLKSLPKGPLIIDVGSVKSGIVKEAARRRLRFVGSHPVAGTEKGGARAGDKNLFRGRLCVLTPAPRASKKDVRIVESLWKRLGARTVSMEAVDHDRLFAVTSHLPHVLAFVLSRTAGRRLSAKQGAFVFGSFRDATRVALSPVEMWRDIFLENRREVLKAVDGAVKEIRALRSLVAAGRPRPLSAFLKRAQKARRSLES